MQLTTAVEIPAREIAITYKSRLLLMGSCFAGNIGAKLSDNKFRVQLNPFGILYNPLSIAYTLERILDRELFDEQSPEILYHQERWHSFMHHSDFSCREKRDTIDRINNSLLEASDCLNSLDYLIVTYGTAYVYRRKENNRVVGNCHKLPASEFTRELLSVDEIVKSTAPIIERIIALRPTAKIVFTVSPIRHLRDGAHDNQRSKAMLILAIEELRRLFPHNTTYFPAYEIMLDELRDYRFFAEDMIHPSSVAIEYIWEKFQTFSFDSSTIATSKEINEIMRALAHRPFDEHSHNYHRFIGDTLRKIELLKEREPYIDFEKEITKCNTILNR